MHFRPFRPLAIRKQWLRYRPTPPKNLSYGNAPPWFFRYNFRGRRPRVKNEPPYQSWGDVHYNTLVVDVRHKLGFSLPACEIGLVRVKFSFFCFTVFHRTFFYHNLIVMDQGWCHLTDFRMLFPMPPTEWESIGNFFLWIFKVINSNPWYYPTIL